jgi:iron complex outermembrane receptor protein/vitamin B12 transporter
MIFILGGFMPRLVLRTRYSALVAFVLFAIAVLVPASARAVVVHGVVTDAFGQPVAGAHIQLIQGPRAVAHAVSGSDGSFEIRSTLAGRFTLLTSAEKFYPGIGQNFYGGSTDQIAQNVVLEVDSVHERATVTTTGTPTPVAQSSSAITLIPQSDLATSVDAVDALRQSSGVFVVQTGQAGLTQQAIGLGEGETEIFVRGGNFSANKVLFDGIPVEVVGGAFDFGSVSSTGLAGVEIYRGSNSALYGTDAGAGVLNFETQRGAATKPQIDYRGEAGNFHSYRNEIALSGTRQKADYYTAFSRFETSNALALDEEHVATAVANLGYALTANTLARFTIRNTDSAAGLPGAHDFYGISANAKRSDQDLYSGLTVENRLSSGWHNLVRYGIARAREQQEQFADVGTLTTTTLFGPVYLGNVVTIRGANGYTATGRAGFYGSSAEDLDSNRDDLYYQSDYSFAHYLSTLFGFHYENERSSRVFPGYAEVGQPTRTNFEYTAQFQGEIKSRLFYSLGGSVEKNHVYGITGSPRLGLSYDAIRPDAKWFHGTLLRANVANGTQEPTLYQQLTSFYSKLQENGLASTIAQDHIPQLGPQDSRTYDLGVDQNIRGDKLILKLGYYHNSYNHQIEGIDSKALVNVFNIPASLEYFYGTTFNTLAYRAQGFETELQYRPFTRLYIHGGYTYLDAVVTQSFSSDAYENGTSELDTNPNLPGIAIGANAPLIGARPFQLAPHTGFFSVQYTGNKFGAAFKGALASRSDDSTYLGSDDATSLNTLLLPNRDLDFGYAKLDANITYALTRRTTAFTELDNLLSQQHIGPIGYPALPFTIHAGVKVRLGGN